MNRTDQRKITRNLIVLRKVIQNDLDVIVERLVDAHVFSKDVCQEIRGARPNLPQFRCGMLINKLLRSGRDSYKRFRKILEERGYHSLVETLEKSAHESTDAPKQSDEIVREKTFIIASPRLPEVPQDNTKTSDKTKTSENPIDEVMQLERMMTFVMTHCDERDSNNNKTESTRDFRHRLLEESKGNGELLGFFRSFRYGSFSLTSQSLVH